MLSGSSAKEPVKAEPAKPAEPAKTEPEAKTETPEVEAKPAETEKTETAPGTVEKQEPEEVEEELPDGVKKRIAKEAKKQAQIQSEIAKAVSATKAKEAELKALTDKPGSDPVKTTESAKDTKPVRPKLPKMGQKGFENETYTEFEQREEDFENVLLPKYEEERDSWLTEQIQAKTRESVEQELTARQKQADLTREWDAAKKEYGAEFPKLMEKLAESAPEGLQVAISMLSDWPRVAAHLAKTPDELHSMVEKFNTNPYGAIAELGKLEDRLKPAPKTEPAKTVEKPLPPPPAKPGGQATATAAVNLDTADMATFSRTVRPILERNRR